MKKTLPVLFALLLITAFFVYVSQAQMPQKGSKNTVTLPNGDVIWDLNGEWNALYEHYGTMEWVGNSKGMIMMVQQDSTFVGKTTMDSAWSPKGTEKMRGEMNYPAASYGVSTMNTPILERSKLRGTNPNRN